MQNKSTRPLSPHLTIYKPQLTSTLSILHRITGAFAYVFIIFLQWWITYCLFQGSFEENCFTVLMGTKLGLLALIALSFAIIYHTFAGIRHLFWDMGYGLELKTVYKSGIFVVALAVLSTFAMWVYILLI